MKIERNKVQRNLSKCEKERGNLLSALEKFETDLDKVHQKIQAVSIERDNYKKMYQKATNAAKKSPGGKSTLSDAAKNLKSESVTELETIKSQLRNLEEQKDNGIRRIKELEAQVAKLNQKLLFSENENEKIEKELRNLQNNIRKEPDTKVLGDKQIKEKVDSDRIQYQKKELQLKVEELSIENERLRTDLTLVKNELKNSAQKLETNLELLEEMDQERDRFQNEMDTKDETINELQSTLS